MTVCVETGNIRMSNSKVDRGKAGKPILRHLRRSKTINVSQFLGTDGKPNNEVSFNDEATGERSPSPVPKPTSSCQALKHAVSALTRIDDFILEELGDGFFANVYKATHRVTSEEMVMKINKDSANRASALREVQLMNKLSHPNILKFLGVCVHEGQLHALTEYISGGTLEDLLANKQEELPWTLRIKLSLDIAKGMHYLHMEGVFHRDLTSKNVLIKKGENRNYLAVIADFGLATKIPDPLAIDPLQPVGCPWWMAPEVINAKFYDERADLFSYGVILLEITARIGADPETMPRTTKFGVDYVKFCAIVEYCPLDFLQLAFKCCQFLPEKRPSSGVIITTLEKIYKTLRSNAVPSSGKLHKRSRSEDNIVQSSDSLTALGGEEVFMTPQIIAQAMSKDDPHYSPTNANPFANISKFKDGRKVMEFPRQRVHSGNSNGFGKLGDPMTSSFSSILSGEKPESQSLPSSPIMLRMAAEKLHQASLHGSDAVKTDSRHELRFSLSSDNQENVEDTSGAAERRARFGCNRTRSLGSLDFFNPLCNPGALSRRRGVGPMFPNQSEKTGYCNRETLRIRESSVEDQLDTGLGDSTEFLDDEEGFDSECSRNTNHTHQGLYKEEAASESAPYTSCDESVSSCSLSSYISCGDYKEETEEKLDPSLDFRTVNQDIEKSRQPLKEKKSEVNSDVNRPVIATESESYNHNHFSKDVNGQFNKVSKSKDNQ